MALKDAMEELVVARLAGKYDTMGKSVSDMLTRDGQADELQLDRERVKFIKELKDEIASSKGPTADGEPAVDGEVIEALRRMVQKHSKLI